MGQRVSNVYDLSEKCYLFKFAVPGKSAKITLLVESGIRFHTTKYGRDLPELPSAFAMKLRKFVRTKRLEDVRQIGTDRVVDMKFGSGDAVNHVILELYANGNIVLTDGNYEVLALLRSHEFSDEVKLKVGEVYPIAYSTNMHAGSTRPAVSDAVDDFASLQLSDATHSGGVLAMTAEEFKMWSAQKLAEYREFHAHEELVAAAAAEARQQEVKQQQAQLQQAQQADEGKGAGQVPSKAAKKAAKKALLDQAADAAGPKKKKAKEMNLRQLLLLKDSGVAYCGPEVLDHCLLLAGIKPSARVDTVAMMSEEDIVRMLTALSESGGLMEQLSTPGLPGYIVYKDVASSAIAAEAAPAGAPVEPSSELPAAATAHDPSKEFVEYLPMLFVQHAGKKVLTFPSFDEAVDEFYSKIESQRLEKEAQAAELAAQKKIEKIQRDQEKMQKALAAQQERMQRGAMLLETHAEAVDKAALVINSAVGAGMAWEDIAEMVKVETAQGKNCSRLTLTLSIGLPLSYRVSDADLIRIVFINYCSRQSHCVADFPPGPAAQPDVGQAAGPRLRCFARASRQQRCRTCRKRGSG
jgi:hypothetical protein